jgi:hypothetical protein
VPGANGKTAVFRRADVEALRAELDTPTLRAVVPNRNHSDARSVINSHSDGGPSTIQKYGAPPASDPTAFAVALATSIRAALGVEAPPRVKPWLDLKSAVDYSGLPSSYLVQAARTGTIRAVNVGNGAREFWRFNRDALRK